MILVHGGRFNRGGFNHNDITAADGRVIVTDEGRQLILRPLPG